MTGFSELRPIYLDYNATTPVDERVLEAMLPFLREHFGNPSSGHVFGQQAAAGVERARRQCAALLGAAPEGIVFTSGGSEANNQAILGAAVLGESTGKHIVTTAVEHPAVNAVCVYLANRGYRTTYVPVDESGRVDPVAVGAALTDETILVSVMHANNEVGTIQPVRQIADLAHARGILVHTDCAQSVGKLPVTLTDLGADLLSVAGHKLYAPKGVGLLCGRPGLELPSLIHGAGHETGRRAGTENVAAIVGLGTACELAHAELDHVGHLADLRDALQDGVLAEIPDAVVNGHPSLHLPNTLSVGFCGTAAGDVLAALPEVAASAGAACHGHETIISHVLQAMGVPEDVARGTIRFSVGRMTTPGEIETATPLIGAAVRRVRAR